jgi:hypothetical protein
MFRGCKIGTVTWLMGQVIVLILAPGMTDGGNRVIAVLFWPVFWLSFWPNMLLGHLFRDGAPTWVKHSEPFIEYVASLCGWLLVSLLIASIVHAFHRQRHEA